MKPIRVVREDGGLGDVVRIFAVLDGLAAREPTRPIHYYGPKAYRGLVMGHCGAMARPGCEYIPFEGAQARAVRACKGLPLTGEMAGDEVIDLFCPAWQHEMDTLGEVTEERTALFCAAAGVEVSTPVVQPHGIITSLTPRAIYLHAHSAGAIRNWDDCYWRELANQLTTRGFTIVHHTENQTWHDLILAVGSCALVVGVDSGIFHLAGGLDVPALGLFGATNGRIISSIWPKAEYIQALPNMHTCLGACYGYAERGFTGGACLHGCQDMLKIQPEHVANKIMEMTS